MVSKLDFWKSAICFRGAGELATVVYLFQIITLLGIEIDLCLSKVRHELDDPGIMAFLLDPLKLMTTQQHSSHY